MKISTTDPIGYAQDKIAYLARGVGRAEALGDGSGFAGGYAATGRAGFAQDTVH